VTPEVIDSTRERWLRVRQSAGLADILAGDFGEKGLARHTADVHVRLLILPADPFVTVTEFDDETWKWWLTDAPNPFEGGRPTNWGAESVPVSDAAVRFSRRGGDRWQWDSYLALHRNGALEFGLGEDGSRSWQRREGDIEIRVFFLTCIVGRVWWAIARYEDVINRLGIDGPWELTIGLRSTKDSVLGNVAAGWAEPLAAGGSRPPECPDTNVLIVREIAEWSTNEAQSLAFSLGGGIEDAWGSKQRRFLARIEPGIGEFDVSRYG
jgi:hypothetical protein